MKTEPIFLVGTQIRANLEQILASASRADLAVAYWGKAALPMLTEEAWTKPTRVICDLMSGFCHVPTIRALKAKGGIRVKRSLRLHAKVYWTPTAAIVGSANASAYGLNGQPESNKEAALLTARQNALLNIADWFEQQWIAASEITTGDLLDSEDKAKQRQQNEPPPIDQPTKEQRFLTEILKPEAWAIVMGWARAQPTVVAVRFGTEGTKGEQPNFQVVHSDGRMESYWFPANGEGPKRRTPDWDNGNLTRPIPVHRSPA